MSLDRERAPIVTPTSPPPAAGSITRVSVIDFDMPFFSIVLLMVKWTIAAIPALIILVLIAAVLAGIFGGVAAALF